MFGKEKIEFANAHCEEKVSSKRLTQQNALAKCSKVSSSLICCQAHANTCAKGNPALALRRKPHRKYEPRNLVNKYLLILLTPMLVGDF